MKEREERLIELLSGATEETLREFTVYLSELEEDLKQAPVFQREGDERRQE